MREIPSLLISTLLEAYRAGKVTPVEVMEHVVATVEAAPERRVWITLLPKDAILARANALLQRSPDSLPLYGIPFAIKDNIDLEGIPTTAGCPDYAYTPATSAFVVQKLIDAGAIPIGKTNLDQFATGLVGTRTPYGACLNSFDPAYIAGGSSSGSAVAVATGLASFALGTDTAGSGRVPAAFNNIVGLKPTCGRLSTTGVVPACRSLDCVSVFALTADDAARVCAVAEGFDSKDPYSRELRRSPWLWEYEPDDRIPRTSPASTSPFRFGVPRADQLELFGDRDAALLFDEAVHRLQALGGERVEIDFAPFLEAARLLYEGPWVAERYSAVGDFLERSPQSVHPVTFRILSAGRQATAVAAFHAQYRLMELRRASLQAWRQADILVTPTAGTIYRIADVEADPIRLNSQLGHYTNFVNLLDLAAVAVPAGFRNDGLPFGVTLIGPAWSDHRLLQLADRLHRATVGTLGALDAPMPGRPHWPPVDTGERIPVAVCGAHMEGLPLNAQLTSRAAVKVSSTRTAAAYRLYALPGGPPDRPGLVRVPSGGASIQVEVWSVPADAFGSFVAGIPAPLGIGKVQLEDSSAICGFLCESHAVSDAQDITALGGWRAYLERRAARS